MALRNHNQATKKKKNTTKQQTACRMQATAPSTTLPTAGKQPSTELDAALHDRPPLGKNE
jgi:hypothetical protein